MTVYKLKSKSSSGNMPKGFEFQVISASISSPASEDIRKAIEKLGFDNQAQKYASAGNFEVTKC